MLHVLKKKQTQPLVIFFFISKSAMLKKLDLYLRKIQISFDEEKFRSTSMEDANLFCCKEKFKFASKKDADLFFLRKNSDLHLRKMQIHFI